MVNPNIPEFHEYQWNKKWIKEQVENVFNSSTIQLKDLKSRVVDSVPNEKITSILSDFKWKMEKGGGFKKFLLSSDANSAWFTLALQIALNKLAHNPWKIDALYGNNTKAAVEKFQNNWNTKNQKKIDAENLEALTEDWVAGPLTLERMLEELNKLDSTKEKAKKIPDIVLPSATSPVDKTYVASPPIDQKIFSETPNHDLSQIKQQFVLPEWERTATETTDYVSTPPKHTIVLSATINSIPVKISFDKKTPSFSTSNVYPIVPTYENPILIEGQDSFELEIDDKNQITLKTNESVSAKATSSGVEINSNSQEKVEAGTTSTNQAVVMEEPKWEEQKEQETAKWNWKDKEVIETPEDIKKSLDTELLGLVGARYDIIWINDISAKYLDSNQTPTISWNVWDQIVTIKFDQRSLDNPVLQVGEDLNLHLITPKVESEKAKIYIVPDTIAVLKKFKNYASSLKIWKETLLGWKFDFSDSDKVTIVFKDGDNEIKISFKNNGGLVDGQNNISIGTDTYTASLENWDQPAKIVLTKNETNGIINEEENQLPEIDNTLDEKTQIEDIIKNKLRIDKFSITEKNNWIFEVMLIARITESMFKSKLSDYLIINSKWFPRNPVIEIRKPFPWEKEFLGKYNFYPENMINWIEKNDSWYKIKSDWFDIWFDLEKRNPQIIIWEKEYPLYVKKITTNWMVIEDQVAIEKSLINNLEKIYNLTKDLSISDNKIDWLEFDLSNEKWITIETKYNPKFKLNFDNKWNLISNFKQIWSENFNVYTENNIVKLEKIENNTVSFEKANNLLEKTNLIKVDDNWDFICEDIYQIEDIWDSYNQYISELNTDTTKPEWESIKTKISNLSDDNKIKEILKVEEKMDKWIKIYKTYEKINDKKIEINKLDWFKVGPNWSAKVSEFIKKERRMFGLGREETTNYISKIDNNKIKISQKLIELKNNKDLKPILNTGN